MSWTQVTTTPRYTKREKQAYQARRRRRNEGVRTELLRGWTADWVIIDEVHHFADNRGRSVPTARVSKEIL